MQINIKQLILEGYTLEAIVEAVHANHPQLDKSRFKDKKLSYVYLFYFRYLRGE